MPGQRQLTQPLSIPKGRALLCPSPPVPLYLDPLETSAEDLGGVPGTLDSVVGDVVECVPLLSETVLHAHQCLQKRVTFLKPMNFSRSRTNCYNVGDLSPVCTTQLFGDYNIPLRIPRL